MRAVVLAAGEGTRLRPYTSDQPKCLVPLAGRPLLDWQLDALTAAGVEDVTVVTGYRAEQVDARVSGRGVATVRNDRYADTNMVASLMCARDRLDGAADVVVAYGDLVYEPRIVTTLLQTLRAGAAGVVITVDRSWRRLWELRMDDPLADAETLRLGPDGTVVELGRRPRGYDEIEGQYMGLLGVRAEAAPRLVAAYDALDPAGPHEGRTRAQMYMTTFLQHLVDHVMPVGAALVDGGWLEVDTVEDLERYEALRVEGRLDSYFAPMGG
jgi:choline kinase